MRTIARERASSVALVLLIAAVTRTPALADAAAPTPAPLSGRSTVSSDILWQNLSTHVRADAVVTMAHAEERGSYYNHSYLQRGLMARIDNGMAVSAALGDSLVLIEMDRSEQHWGGIVARLHPANTDWREVWASREHLSWCVRNVESLDELGSVGGDLAWKLPLQTSGFHRSFDEVPRGLQARASAPFRVTTAQGQRARTRCAGADRRRTASCHRCRRRQHGKWASGAVL